MADYGFTDDEWKTLIQEINKEPGVEHIRGKWMRTLNIEVSSIFGKHSETKVRRVAANNRAKVNFIRPGGKAGTKI